MAFGAQPRGHQLVSPSSDVESLAKGDRWNRFKPENYEDELSVIGNNRLPWNPWQDFYYTTDALKPR
jgi:hypothetical protein